MKLNFHAYLYKKKIMEGGGVFLEGRYNFIQVLDTSSSIKYHDYRIQNIDLKAMV